MPRATFADRLALARRLIARRSPSPAVHLADQLGAASAETRVLHDRIGEVLPIMAPDREWRQRIDADPSADVQAHVLAAVIGCTIVCVHIRRGGPRPTIVRLALCRVDCVRCVQTLRRPPPENDDQCDLCNRHGVTIFHPFAMRQGPALVVGDACPSCAAVLGIVQEVAS